jgi:hypothetical protein
VDFLWIWSGFLSIWGRLRTSDGLPFGVGFINLDWSRILRILGGRSGVDLCRLGSILVGLRRPQLMKHLSGESVDLRWVSVDLRSVSVDLRGSGAALGGSLWIWSGFLSILVDDLPVDSEGFQMPSKPG